MSARAKLHGSRHMHVAFSRVAQYGMPLKSLLQDYHWAEFRVARDINVHSVPLRIRGSVLGMPVRAFTTSVLKQLYKSMLSPLPRYSRPRAPFSWLVSQPFPLP